jgi:glutathione S-transferase
MKLYYSPGTCSLSPHIVARELGLDLTLVKVDLATKRTDDGRDFTTVNPKGYVPALELDDGRLLTEGAAIVQYLADRETAVPLTPAVGSFERSRLQEMLAYINTELHKPYGPLFRPSASQAQKDESHASLQKRYGLIEERLRANTWLVGDAYSVADAYLFVVTKWAGMVNVDLTAFPQLQAFQTRMAQRPAVHAALVAEGLVAAA